MGTAILEMPGETTTRNEKMTLPAGLDRVVMTGFMGSGKTTVGEKVAERLGWRFVDLDREIERREGRSVPEIFAESSEGHFRRLETAVLASLLGQKKVVIALGGGAPEELGNRLLLEQTPHTVVVYLSADLETLLERCAVQARDPAAVMRPVLADRAKVEVRFQLRRPTYERIASHRVETTELVLDEVVEAVVQRLTSREMTNT